MGMMTSMTLSAQGMSVQQDVMDIAAENLANINTTRTEDGGPYKKKEMSISSKPMSSFQQGLDELMTNVSGLQMPTRGEIKESNAAPTVIYDPNHPDADEEGNVLMPNISAMEETMKMMIASKAYQANISSFNATKTMYLRTLEIGGG